MDREKRQVIIECDGHPNIRATHAKTFEFVSEDTVTQSGTCIIGVNCSYDENALLELRGQVLIQLKCGDIEESLTARINPTFRRGDPLIFRRHDKSQSRTLCTSSSKGASLLNRDLISALQKPGAKLKVTVSEVASESPDTGVLYIVGMPIGNSSDLSLRALDIFQSVDVVLSEDTRTTRSFLSEFGISVDLISYHDHNERERAPQILARLLQGERFALVSEAGMPLISDPGFHIVKAAIDNDVVVCPVPGPDAITTGLSVSGFSPTDFRFMGFLPRKSRARQDLFSSISSLTHVTVFYESPHRILDSLEDLHEIIPEREVALCKDLTKHTDHVYRGSAKSVADQVRELDKPRGELTLIVNSGEVATTTSENAWDDIDSSKLINCLVQAGCSTKMLSQAIAQSSSIKKKEAFNEIIRLKEEGE